MVTPEIIQHSASDCGEAEFRDDKNIDAIHACFKFADGTLPKAGIDK